MNNTESEIANVVLSCLAVFALLLFWTVGSCIEANSYKRVTGKDVSTWDAMWLSLRIQDEAQ